MEICFSSEIEISLLFQRLLGVLSIAAFGFCLVILPAPSAVAHRKIGKLLVKSEFLLHIAWAIFFLISSSVFVFNARWGHELGFPLHLIAISALITIPLWFSYLAGKRSPGSFIGVKIIKGYGVKTNPCQDKKKGGGR